MRTIRFTLNGEPASVTVDEERMLLWVLRTELGLTGTKYGCGEGYCGACTVIVGDEAVRSCRYPVKNIEGKKVTTIEGLARDGKLHPLQEAFAGNDAFQCGYCTPGMLMSAYGLLLRKPKPTPRRSGTSSRGTPAAVPRIRASSRRSRKRLPPRKGAGHEKRRAR